MRLLIRNLLLLVKVRGTSMVLDILHHLLNPTYIVSEKKRLSQMKDVERIETRQAALLTVWGISLAGENKAVKNKTPGGGTMMHLNNNFAQKFLLLFSALVLLLTPFLASGATERITDNDTPDEWIGNRPGDKNNKTLSQGKILWSDKQNFDSGRTVFFYDSTQANPTVEIVQEENQNDPPQSGTANTVFVLGSGASPGEVIGAWRRGTDFAWVWRDDGSGTLSSPLLVDTLQSNPDTPLNPERVYIADGCVFIILQDLAASITKKFYQINPNTGDATLIPNTGFVGRLRTSSCQVTWVERSFTDGDKIFFYDGSNDPFEIDSGEIQHHPELNRGTIVYEKVDSNGINQIFLYDTTADNPAPVQLTSETDPLKGNFYPQTDGQNVAWVHGDNDGKNLTLILNGVALTDNTNGPQDTAFDGGGDFPPFQLHRGQIAWLDIDDLLHYYDGNSIVTVDIAPATEVKNPWLADGYIAWYGLSNDGGTDKEIFLFTGTPPQVTDLTLTKNGNPDPVFVGGDLTYSISVANNGQTDASGVILSDTLPAGVGFVLANADQGSCAENGGVVTCDLGTLAGGDSVKVTLVVTPNAAGVITNTARVLATTIDRDLSNNTVSEETTVMASPGGNNPPSRPELIVPAEGETGVSLPVTFVWNAATDPDGDAVSYDLLVCEDSSFPAASCTPIQVALLVQEHVVYAGLGGTGVMLLFMGVGFGFGRPRRTRALLSLGVILLVSGMLVSCGGGGGGGGTQTTGPGGSGGEVSHTVSGLNPSTTYFWKVVADDGKGGQTESETRSFTTQ